MDERTDMVRAARDRRWKYLRNYMPHLPWAQHISYMYEMPTMKVWQRLADEGKLAGPQKTFFEPKPPEELYDTESDPWEVKNLAADPAHRETLERMRKALRDWMLEIRDLGFLSEAELRARFGGRPQHEAVRSDPASYPLERLIDAAELASRGDRKALELLEDKDSAFRYWGALACRVMGKGCTAAETLLRLLGDPAPWVRVAAADALCDLGRLEDALPVLARGLKDENDWVRLQAANALDRLDAKARPVEAAIRAAADDKQDYVKRVIGHALKAFQP
jgi:HEAT repeat protein